MPDEHDNHSLVPTQSGPILMHIAERVLNRPLLMHPAKAEIILHVLEGRLPLGGSGLEPLSPDANRFLGSSTRPDGRERKYRVRDGTAIVPIVGSLVNRGGWIGANSGLTSYEGLSAQLREADADPDVSSVLLDIDSPGGEATGMFAVAEQVRLVGQSKPVTAFVNDMAASAAYGIASAASEIVVSPTSVVGSIGVVMTHMDRSRQMERQGVKPTLIYAGKHKVDGNPFGPLSEDVRADLQAEVARFYDQFVSLVDRGRAGMTEQTIRATEARTYIGQDAIDRGLADRMASLDEVLDDLSSTARGANKRSWFGMSKTTEAAPQAEIAGISPEAHAAAVAAARAEGHVEGVVAERNRIGAIYESEAAEGRLKQAMTLALKTDLSIEQAAEVLNVSPKEASATTPVPSIAERAAAEREFGSSIAAEPAIQKTKSGWAKAVENANRSIGAKR
jgi:signal peptide peptidase SppA